MRVCKIVNCNKELCNITKRFSIIYLIELSLTFVFIKINTMFLNTVQMTIRFVELFLYKNLMT